MCWIGIPRAFALEGVSSGTGYDTQTAVDAESAMRHYVDVNCINASDLRAILQILCLQPIKIGEARISHIRRGLMWCMTSLRQSGIMPVLAGRIVVLTGQQKHLPLWCFRAQTDQQMSNSHQNSKM